MTHHTQITLNFDIASGLQLRNPYNWHQRVWDFFPGRSRECRDFLIRLDQYSESFRLLIVSVSKPTRPSWCPLESWRSKSIPESYFSHHRYTFQLCANPTKKVAKLGMNDQLTKNGKRVPLQTREEYVDWILRKGEQGGFIVDESTLCVFSHGRKYFEKQGVLGLHSAVEFKGVLEVTDPCKFREIVVRGIGTAKAFGFGLLVIAPTE